MEFVNNVSFSTTVTFGIILLICFLKLFEYHWKRRHLYLFASKLPGPVAYPFVGNALYFATNANELLNRLMNILQTYSSPCRFWFGSELCIIIYDPDDIEMILTDSRTTYKDKSYRFIEPFLGQGLINASGPLWKLHRKLILPTFNSKTLQSYISTFNSHSKILTNILEKNVNGPAFDVITYLNNCTIDIICDTLMGINIEAQFDQNEHFVESVETAYRVVHERMLKVWLQPDFVFKFTNCYKETMRAQKVIRDFAENKLQEKKREFETGIYDGIEKAKLTTVEQLFFINRNEEFFTDEELRDEIYTLFIAGQDTTATVSSFVLLMMGMHEEIQERVYEEIVEQLGNGKECEMKPSNYADMKYLDMVIKETLRLFVVGPMMIREIHEDFKIKNHTLPAGCSVMIAMVQTHRMKKHWPNPDAFIPERFTPEIAAKRHPFAYIPFSAGARSCIGQKYAVMAIKTIVAHVLHKFKVECDEKYEDIQLKCDISVRSKNGYKIRLIPR